MSRRGWVLWWLAVVLLGTTQAWLSHARRELLGEIHMLAGRKRTLLLHIERLELERAALLRPNRLRKLATKLGMRPPRPEQVWRDEAP